MDSDPNDCNQLSSIILERVYICIINQLYSLVINELLLFFLIK
jgi:hypothetical protein